MRDSYRFSPDQLRSKTGRFEYVLAAFLRAVEASSGDAVNIWVALGHRFPDEFRTWVEAHPEDIPDYVAERLLGSGVELNKLVEAEPYVPGRGDIARLVHEEWVEEVRMCTRPD